MRAQAGECDVTVIIVNRNGGNYLPKCLTALAEQTLTPKRVILVDNGSTDSSLAKAEACYPGVQVIRLGKNRGFAFANNLAVEQAETGWIALLNPDAFPNRDWLETLYRTACSHPDYASFGCRLLKAHEPTRLDGAGDCYHVSGLSWRRFHGYGEKDRAMECEEVFSVCAAAALYRRIVFLEVGGFDENYFCYMEDVDLGYRLRLFGYRCLYVPTAIVHHVGSGLSGNRSDFAVYFGHRNLVWTYVKNMPAPLFWQYLPLHLLLNLVSGLWLGLRGQGRVYLSAKKEAVRLLPRVWRQRKQIQRQRKVSTRQLKRFMARGFASLMHRHRNSLSP